MRVINKPGFLWMILLLLAGCSPKIRTVKTDPQKPVEEKVPDKKPVKKISEASVSLLLPFELDKINLKTANRSDIEQYAMPIDFYQGFKIGLDSVSRSGINIKLNVFDTEDDNARIAQLLKNESLKQSNLIVGPVFPEGIKFAADYSRVNKKAFVSPLAASQPSEFGNPNLVSVVNNIDQHARRIATYITKNYNPANTIIVLLNTKKTEDEEYATPLREFFKQAANTKYNLQEYASAFSMETRMIKGKTYVVVLCSSDKNFVNPTIDKLYKLKTVSSAAYNINLFGHPLWAKQSYAAEKLQVLNTIISSSYKVDYKSAAVINFIKKYRAVYGFEPSEYAFKGFDTGYYFGKMVATYGADYASHLPKEKYKGLSNSFSFVYNEKYGYVNTSLMLLKYKNFAMNLID